MGNGGICNTLSVISNPIFVDSPMHEAEGLYGINASVETKKRKVTSFSQNEVWQDENNTDDKIDEEEGSDYFLGVGPAERAHPS